MRYGYLLCATFLTVGCGSNEGPKSVYDIGKCSDDDESTELAGIPFYTVEYNEVTTRYFRQDVIKLTAKVNGGISQAPSPFFTDDRDLAECILKKFDKLNEPTREEAERVLGGEGCDGTLDKLPPAPLKCEEVNDADAVATTKTVEKSVQDVRRCINVNYPKKGTASASISLNEDGLLTGAEASVEKPSSLLDDVLSAVLEVVPLGGLFEKLFGVTKEEKDGGPRFLREGRMSLEPELLAARVYTKKGDGCDNFTMTMAPLPEEDDEDEDED